MRFEGVDNFVLFGGGRLLAETAIVLKRAGRRVSVATSPRTIDARLAGLTQTFREALEAQSIELIVSENVKTDPKVLEKITPGTMGFSIGAAWVFNAEFINRFGGKLLNLHGARLPQERGGAAFSWYILSGHRLGCCLIHVVEPGLDDGPIVKFREFIYPAWCRTPKDYELAYREINTPFLEEFFAEVARGADFVPTGQPEYLSMYWPRLSTEHHGYIDWNWHVRDIERFICAFDDPYIGASTFVNGTRAYFTQALMNTSEGVFHPFQWGLVYRKSGGHVFVAANGGTLVVGSVKSSEGGDMMPDLQVGDRFHTPAERLDQARQFRAVFTPRGLKGSS